MMPQESENKVTDVHDITSTGNYAAAQSAHSKTKGMPMPSEE